MANPGPAVANSVNTQSPRSTLQFLQTIAVAITPVALVASTSAEQSYGLNGASFATAATGILPGDVITAINHPSLTAGTGIGGFRVDTAVVDKFYVVWTNSTAGTPTPAAGTYLITVARYNQAASGEASPATFSNLPSSLTSN